MSQRSRRGGLTVSLALSSATVAVLGSGTASAEPPTFEHSYIITSREAPGAQDANLDVLTDGRMFFCSAAGHYVQTVADYATAAGTICNQQPNPSESSATPPESFLSNLERDLLLTVGQDRTAHLMLYIHGLNVLFADAVQEGPQFGLHFQGANLDNAGAGTTTCDATPLPQDCILCPQDARKAIHPGLLISFDWPSFAAGDDLSTLIFALPILLAPQTGRETRQRADDSAEALVNVFEGVVLELRRRLKAQRIQLRTTVIAHSEGNYVLERGASAAVLRDIRPKRIFDDVILLAADLSAAAVDRNSTGAAISDIGERITAYYSTSDPDMLITSYLWSSLHNLEFQARLGSEGPYSQLPHVVGIDATRATNRIIPDIADLTPEEFEACLVPSDLQNPKPTPVLNGLLAQHGSYRCVAEILDDMTATMLGGVNRFPDADRRIKAPGTNGRFVLQTDDDPPLFSCQDWEAAGLGGPDAPALDSDQARSIETRARSLPAGRP